MDEVLTRRIIIGLLIVCVGLGVWLGLLYRNGGDTEDALVAAQSELDASIAGNARLAEELAGAGETVERLESEQRESDSYQQLLEEELEHFKDILVQLESTTANITESIGRVDDISREYTDLIEEGNRFIEDGEE